MFGEPRPAFLSFKALSNFVITAQSELRERDHRRPATHPLSLADPHDPCLPASQIWPLPSAATPRAPSVRQDPTRRRRRSTEYSRWRFPSVDSVAASLL